MTFNKRQIANFKAKGRFYITWRKNLKPQQIKKFFYNDDQERYHIKNLFKGKNLQYCYCYMYDIVVGDYQLGLKYENEDGTYYMFWAANSFWAYPQDIAVGKAVDGEVYLVREHFSDGRKLNFRVISEEYITKNERGFRPKSYNHSIFVMRSHIEEVIEEITDEDVKCLKIAYEGVRAFSKLIEEIS